MQALNELGRLDLAPDVQVEQAAHKRDALVELGAVLVLQVIIARVVVVARGVRLFAIRRARGRGVELFAARLERKVDSMGLAEHKDAGSSNHLVDSYMRAAGLGLTVDEDVD